MKNIRLGLLLAGLIIFVISCKNEPKENVLTEGEVEQSPAALNEEANALDIAVDTLAADFDKAGESIERTIENIEKGQEQLQQNVDESIKKASK